MQPSPHSPDGVAFARGVSILCQALTRLLVPTLLFPSLSKCSQDSPKRSSPLSLCTGIYFVLHPGLGWHWGGLTSGPWGLLSPR